MKNYSKIFLTVILCFCAIKSYSLNTASMVTIDITDSLIFDLSQAQCTSGTIEFPIYISSDENVYAIDFSLKFNPSVFTFNSVSDVQPYMNSSAYFNTADSTLRFSSFSLQPIDNVTNLTLIRFNLPSAQINQARFDSVFTLLNGDNCGYLIIDPQLPLNLNISINPVINPGDSILLSVEPNPMFNYSWSNGSTGNSTYVYTPGIYTVSVGVIQGCSSTVSIEILAPSPLPVELVSFNAIQQSGFILLNWQTVSETSCSFFELQKLKEQEHWTEIGHIPGSGNSNIMREYLFEDFNVNEGNNYYRLKQVDFDGQFEYSRVINGVFKSNKALTSLQIIPNPVNLSNENMITLQNVELDEPVLVRIIQMNGTEVYRTSLNPILHEIKIDLSQNHFQQVKQGVYWIIVSGENTSLSGKLLVY